MAKNKPQVSQDGSNTRELFEAARECIKSKRYRKAERLLQRVTKAEEDHREAIAALSQLSRRRAIWNFRLALVLIFCFTTIAIFYLQWKHRSSTQVTIDMSVSEFSATLGEPLNLNAIRARAIGVSHLDNLTVEHLGVEQAIVDPKTDAVKKWNRLDVDNPLRIESLADDWSVSIESEYVAANLSIAAGSTVRFAQNETDGGQLRLEVTGEASGSADVADRFLLTCNNCQIRERSGNPAQSASRKLRITPLDREVRFQSKQSPLIMSLDTGHPADSKPLALARNLTVSTIDFSRLEGEERESTIVEDGAVYFSDLDGKKLPIRATDFVVLGLNKFQIRRLTLDGHLTLSLQGSVDNLNTGTGGFMYSRLPSYLEWLYKNESLRLFLAVLIPVVSTILAILYRLKVFSDV